MGAGGDGGTFVVGDVHPDALTSERAAYDLQLASFGHRAPRSCASQVQRDIFHVSTDYFEKKFHASFSVADAPPTVRARRLAASIGRLPSAPPH
jgi:hypothetical protein